MTDDHHAERDAWTAWRVLSMLTRKQFARAVDDELRGERPRLPYRSRYLKALVARDGWQACLAAAETVARRQTPIRR